MEAVEGLQPHEDARRAFDRNDYRMVESVLGGLARRQLLREPELCLLLASAQTRLFKYADAKLLLEELQPYVIESRDEWLLRRWENGYAVHLIHEGHLDEAKLLLDRCVSSAEASAQQRFVGYVNNTIGVLAAHLGEIDRALAHFSRSIVAWRQIGDARRVGFGHYNAAVVLREWYRPGEAAVQLFLSLQYIGADETREESVITGAERAMLLSALGDASQSERVARQTQTCAESLESPFLRAVASRTLGAVLLKNGHMEEAGQCLRDAYHAIEATKNIMLRAEIFEELACFEYHAGRPTEARGWETGAVALFERMKSPKHAERCRRRIQSGVNFRAFE